MAQELRALRRPVDAEPDQTAFAAPSPGRFTAAVRVGRLVEPGQVLGSLRVLERVYAVVAPEGPTLRVARVATRTHLSPVAYGDELLVAVPADSDAAQQQSSGELAGLGDLPPNARLFRAPMAGQFYRRPSPEDPLFCEEGQVIRRGSQLGLVEVMKFFYPLTFDEEGSWTVLRFVAEDGKPLDAGAPVLVLVPA